MALLSTCVKEGGMAFAKAHGSDVIRMGSIGVRLLADVGGGTGMLIREIVKVHPHVHGINFDLPHVVATTPDECTRVAHVGGDMLVEIPLADAIIIKVRRI
ncbi:hypothetical protein IFM89_015719 [Coptis chinensis]|uniref:O-methyltransferase C-terminal domain-containing protein n=1 Tax=Coptis chinensis TaxID=261450 RepID=A0A835GYD0_9MAGN|nr:hypothetical protein IFM89_015719 [Coptis chinensis]